MLGMNIKQIKEQGSLNASKSTASPSSSTEVRKMVTFEDDGTFTLNDINITVPKVIGSSLDLNLRNCINGVYFVVGMLNRDYGKSG